MPRAVDRNRLRRLLREHAARGAPGDRAFDIDRCASSARCASRRHRRRVAESRALLARIVLTRMKTLLLAALRGYQYALRPMLGANCRFYRVARTMRARRSSGMER